MNSRKRMSFVAMALLAALAIPFPLSAQNSEHRSHQHHHYQFVDLGTFGGPGSGVNIEPFQTAINNAGRVVGGADTSTPSSAPGCYNPVNIPDCFISHAFVFTDGHLRDLGTLPGGDEFSFAGAINRRGQVAGTSENGQIDPVTGNPEFHAVLWHDDNILDLGTLGGVSSFAATLNDRGQVVGPALNDIPDPYSILGFGSATTLTQTRAFLWEHGTMKDLGTLGGPDSWPVFVNNRGQVAGTSYTSDIVDPNTGLPPVSVFLWEDGKMKDLGNLGGDNGLLSPYGIVYGLNNRGQVTGDMEMPDNQSVHAFVGDRKKLSDLGTLGGSSSFAEHINDVGDVVGEAMLAGDQTTDAFLWRDGVMTDLGTVDGDTCSSGLGLNSRGQVVGASEDAAAQCNTWTHAFLWENGGPSVDLNTLIPAGSSLQLFAAYDITDRGEIVGGGMLPSCIDSDHCSSLHAFLLIPCDEEHPDVEGCDYDLVDTAVAAQSPAPRYATSGTQRPSQSRRTNRYHIPGWRAPRK